MQLELNHQLRQYFIQHINNRTTSSVDYLQHFVELPEEEKVRLFNFDLDEFHDLLPAVLDGFEFGAEELK